MLPKKISAIIIDNDERSKESIERILERLAIPFEFVDSAIKTSDYLKKNIFGVLKYNTFIISDELEDDYAFTLAKMLNDNYKNKVYTIIITNKENSNSWQKYYTVGVTMVIPRDILQSSLFNWYMKLKKGNLVDIDTQPKKYDFSGHKVLLVEDNDLNMEITTALLQDVGLEVVQANNGTVAVEVFMSSKDEEISLILMDIQMPTMDGYEATEIIRLSDHKNSETIPIVALSSNNLLDDVVKARRVGMDDYIFKPISTKNLYEIIEKFINNKQNT